VLEINNNLNLAVMKRTVLLFLISAIVLITCVLWFLKSGLGFKHVDLLNFGVITLIVAFALYAGIRKLQSAKRGEPTKDELSKKIMQKASSLSFYISLYAWLGIMYLSDKVNIPVSSLIGAGILGMALVFAVTWIIINFIGINGE